MIDLRQRELKNTIKINNQDFKINTDYRVWLKFVIEFENWIDEGAISDIDISYIFKGSLPVFTSKDDYKSILEFAFPKSELPYENSEERERTLYLEYDMDYIFAAFFQAYDIDLTEVNMHWHKFRALLQALPEKTMLSQIMSYRAYTGHENSKDEKEIYSKLKNLWTPKPKPTKEELKAEEEFEKYFDV